jgi:hypothetical protein
MITSHLSAELVSSVVVERSYVTAPTDGSPVVVATMFNDSPEYLSFDFVGPARMERHYTIRVLSHVGRVVETFSREERIMSDVWDDVRYAVVYTDEGDYKNVRLGHDVSAVVDAGPALMAKYAEHKKLTAEYAAVRARVKAGRDAVAAAKREAMTVRKGKTIKVVKGRKVPKGTVGECIWVGAGANYGYGEAPLRVGLKTATGEVHWTAYSNVAVAA